MPERGPDGLVRMLTAARLDADRVQDGPGADRLAALLERSQA